MTDVEEDKLYIKKLNKKKITNKSRLDSFKNLILCEIMHTKKQNSLYLFIVSVTDFISLDRATILYNDEIKVKTNFYFCLDYGWLYVNRV
jgi:hypothetical protein